MVRSFSVGADAVDRLARLHVKSFDASWSEAEFLSLLANPHVAGLILQEDGSDAGMALVQSVAQESEILTLCILPRLRGNGLGYQLLHACCDIARVAGSRHLFLEVSDRNAPAMALYTGFGFTETGRRPRYYGDDSDAVLMTFALQAGTG